ncbi:uncharacterized protein LOC134794421 [Cydia splendana]|uniref:uncharacterized protein LOC134794421 n=1 Tax=Cydia splendana TaxID=1100963 RepID=UPI0028F4C5DC
MYGSPIASAGIIYVDKIAETGNCYWVSPWHVNAWRYARDDCYLSFAELLIIDSENERRIVREVLVQNLDIYNRLTDVLWVGISRDYYSYVWSTVEDELLDEGFAPWAVGRPSGHQYRTCGSIRKYDVHYYDDFCFSDIYDTRYYSELHSTHFVCKKRVVSELLRYT